MRIYRGKITCYGRIWENIINNKDLRLHWKTLEIYFINILGYETIKQIGNNIFELIYFELICKKYLETFNKFSSSPKLGEYELRLNFPHLQKSIFKCERLHTKGW